MSSSERAGEARVDEATAPPLRALGLALWAVVRWLFKACVLMVLAIIIVAVRRALFVPNDPHVSMEKGQEVWGLFAVMLVVMIVVDVAGRFGRRTSFVSEFMQGYRESRAARDPKPDSPSHDARSSDSSAFRDKEAGLLREIRDLKAALAQAAEENASLRAELAMGNDQQGMDQRARAQIRQLESILAFPGVRKTLVKVLHPDTGEGGSNDTRKEIFQTLMAVMDRMGVRG